MKLIFQRFCFAIKIIIISIFGSLLITQFGYIILDNQFSGFRAYQGCAYAYAKMWNTIGQGLEKSNETGLDYTEIMKDTVLPNLNLSEQEWDLIYSGIEKTLQAKEKPEYYLPQTISDFPEKYRPYINYYDPNAWLDPTQVFFQLPKGRVHILTFGDGSTAIVLKWFGKGDHVGCTHQFFEFSFGALMYILGFFSSFLIAKRYFSKTVNRRHTDEEPKVN